MERHRVETKCRILSDFHAFLNAHSQARAIYKQRLDEAAMLERHIMQARARDIAETEHTTKQSRLQVVETPVKLPPGRCEVCLSVCLSVYQPTSTSAAVGIVLYSRHCSVLNIGRENCRPDSPTSTKHFSVHGPTRPACDSLSHGATSVPDPEISFRFQQPNHSFLSSDLSCQTCQVGWAGRPVSPRNLPVSILQVLFQRIIYLF